VKEWEREGEGDNVSNDDKEDEGHCSREREGETGGG